MQGAVFHRGLFGGAYFTRPVFAERSYTERYFIGGILQRGYVLYIPFILGVYFSLYALLLFRGISYRGIYLYAYIG